MVVTLERKVESAASRVRAAWKGPVPWIAVAAAAAVISLMQYGGTLPKPFPYGDMSAGHIDTAYCLARLREGRLLGGLTGPWVDFRILREALIRRGEVPSEAMERWAGCYYRPVAWLWLSADYALWGERAWGFRTSTLIVHLMGLVLLGLLTARMAGARAPGLAATLAFALAGPHQVALTWIWARSDVLCGVFYIGALLALFSARRPWVWSPLLAMGAMGAKEVGITLPLVATIWALLQFRSVKRPQAAALVGMWLMLGGYLVACRAVLGYLVPPDLLGWNAPWPPLLRTYSLFLARPVLDLAWAPHMFRLSGWTLLYLPFWRFVLEQAVFWFSVGLLVKRCPASAVAFFIWKVVVYLPQLRYVIYLGRPWHYIYLPAMGSAMLTGLVIWQAWPLVVAFSRRLARALFPPGPRKQEAAQ